MSKFKGKRMVDEDLIKKLENLQPGGGEYSAGTGIEISSENEISVDTDTIATKSELFSGDYDDLTNKPDLSVYQLAADAFSGDYDDLTNKPDLSIYAESADLSTVATTGAYSDLTGTPTLATVATTGDYDDLTNKPTIPTVDYPVTDVTVNGTSVVSSKVAAVTVPTSATSTSTVTPTTETLTFTYSDNTTGTITFITAATVSTTTTLS